MVSFDVYSACYSVTKMALSVIKMYLSASMQTTKNSITTQKPNMFYCFTSFSIVPGQISTFSIQIYESGSNHLSLTI